MSADTKKTLTSKISDFVNDVATLDVLTLTGDIAFVANEYDKTEKSFKWDAIFEQMAAQMQPAAANKLEVVAYTHAEWDLDSVNFVRKDPSESDKILIEAHNQAVSAAQKSRFEAVKLVAEIVKVSF
jgi:hypothetical protein